MPALPQFASDDQTALMGCVCAFIASVVIMYLSYYLGPQARQTARQRRQAVVPLPQPLRRGEDRAA
uniref:Uncharacterized protein n=1 Tax=Schlesneria paludicola TaxID=360056 RepID=A0A7C4LPL8_9PLAN